MGVIHVSMLYFSCRNFAFLSCVTFPDITLSSTSIFCLFYSAVADNTCNSPFECCVEANCPGGCRSANPTSAPSISLAPSYQPSALPSISSQPSDEPSSIPSLSSIPSTNPTSAPSISLAPSYQPSALPSISTQPSGEPSSIPSLSSSPSTNPTSAPSIILADSYQPGRWYPDWETYTCVQDCVGTPPCGGAAEFWDDLYSSRDECCSTRLSWNMDKCMGN